MIWFTSDTHLGHSNIIPACERPFMDVERMNAAIIANINDRVSVRDTLNVLGDFSYRIPVEEAYRLRCRIKCENVHLVRGTTIKIGRPLLGPMPLQASRTIKSLLPVCATVRSLC